MFVKDLLIYARILRKRWWLIVALLVATVGITTLLSLGAKPTYRAWVKLQVGAPPPTDVSLYSAFRRDEFQDEIAYTRVAFVELLGDEGLAWRTISQVGSKVGVEEFLKERVTIESEAGSNFISVGVSAGTPEEAQALVTTLVEEAISYYGTLQAQSTTATREFVTQELEAVRKDMVEAERALTQFKIENKIGDLDVHIKHQQDLVLSLQISRDHALAQGKTQEVANYNHIIAERQQQLQELVSLSTEYESLVAAMNLARETYNLLLSKETEAKIRENQVLNLGFIQIINPAQLPTRAIPSFNPKIILLSGVVSLIIGVMLAFVWDYVETQLGETEQTVSAHVASQVTSVGEPS